MVLTQWETLCGLFFAFFEKIVVPILTSGGIDWQREKWRDGFGSKFIRQGEKNAVKLSLFWSICDS